MKVRVSITLDIDKEVWAAEYGVEPTADAVRADVKEHVRAGVIDQIGLLGLLARPTNQ